MKKILLGAAMALSVTAVSVRADDDQPQMAMSETFVQKQMEESAVVSAGQIPVILFVLFVILAAGGSGGPFKGE